MRLSYPPEYKALIRSIRRKANKYGVKLIFENSDTVLCNKGDKYGSSGYFLGGKNAKLVVGVGSPFERWILTLIHESCHMDQEYDKKIDTKRKEWESVHDLFEWVEGRSQLNFKNLTKSIDATVEMEWDCEKRSVAKILKFKVTINLDEYIRKANIYLYLHQFIKETRKWYVYLCYDKEIFPIAPNKFCKDVLDYKKIPHDLRKAFVDYKGI